MRNHSTRPYRMIWAATALAATLLCANRGDAATLKVIYTFAGSDDGAEPCGALVSDKDGALYGTTSRGGLGRQCDGYGCGTVFKLTPPTAGQTAWTYSVIYSFFGGPDGATPTSGLAIDKFGFLYGTTEKGGNTNCGGYGCGTVYELKPPKLGQTDYTKALLYRFTGPDGAYPEGTPIVAADGSLFGTTRDGGPHDDGTVYRLNPPSAGESTWTRTGLYAFHGGNDGASPRGSVVQNIATGALYGTLTYGGSAGFGGVFQLHPNPEGGQFWQERLIHEFTDGRTGTYPTSSLLLDAGGRLYGAASTVAFSLTKPAAAGTGSAMPWTRTILHNFHLFADANIPLSGLTRVDFGSTFALYGSAGFGSSSRVGAIYKLVPPALPGGVWTESQIYRFTGGTDGANPFPALLSGKKGILYGVTTFGGNLAVCDVGCGTVFEIDP